MRLFNSLQIQHPPSSPSKENQKEKIISKRKLNDSEVLKRIEKLQQENPSKIKSSSSKGPNTKDYILDSDIGNNDPNKEITREKLKGILAVGGFKFSEKERDVLSKILE